MLQCGGDSIDVGQNDKEAGCDIRQGHKRDNRLRDSRDTSNAPHDHRENNTGETQADDPSLVAEEAVSPSGHVRQLDVGLIGLKHAADPERTNDDADGIIPGQALAQTGQPARAQAAIEVEHWPTTDRAVRVHFTEFYAQRTFGKLRGHSEKSGNQQPERRAGSTHRNTDRDVSNISDADSAGDGCRERLKGRNLARCLGIGVVAANQSQGMGKAPNADETEVESEENGAGHQPGHDQREFSAAQIDSEENDRVELVGKWSKRAFDESFDSGSHLRCLLSRAEGKRQQRESATSWLIMKRTIYSEEHDIFRAGFRRFAEKEIVPRIDGWNAAGITDRETWRAVGDAGYLGAAVPEAYGGAGGDFLFDAILIEEAGRIRAHPLMLSLHSDIVLPYFLDFGTEEQKTRWVPGCVRGETILAIGMTEPGTGSDLANIRTTARRDGDSYILNGSKTFISNGQLADLVVVVCKTDPEIEPGHKGISLIVVEAGSPGFSRGRNLEKLGLKGQDTSELHFEDCRVPAANLLGQEGRGFYHLMQQLQQERLTIAIGSIASSRRSLEDTLDYCKQRSAFGRSIASFQANQFTLAELATQVEVGQAFVDRCLGAHVSGEEIVNEVSMAKWWTTDLQKKLTSECLQLHGGYGFMAEYPISQDYADAAVQSIYAGTNEIMKVLIARGLGLPDA